MAEEIRNIEASVDPMDEVRSRRMETLVGVYSHLTECGTLNKRSHRLSTVLCNEVVEHYISDCRILKMRYNIQDRIQLHKIAGLMACAITRFRPLIPIADQIGNDNELYANETLAIYNGLAICAESNPSQLGHITGQRWFATWHASFRYLLHFRNYTPESIIFVFETLSHWHFPSNFPSNTK